MERSARIIAIATAAAALAAAVPAGAAPPGNFAHYLPPRVTSGVRMLTPNRITTPNKNFPRYRVPPRVTSGERMAAFNRNLPARGGTR